MRAGRNDPCPCGSGHLRLEQRSGVPAGLLE
ncbi:MAG TPA: SEC-C metal-binding domain-containing protein [Longimicrobiaceae bacterium]|nr:SEC-C metal-binding domain-containing protein [Longimicrobiaceae bacterium]